MTKLVGKNNEEKIWNFLINEGFTEAGAAGIMGNLYAESTLKPNNIQNTSESRLGSDTYYTAAINDKSYTKEQFVNDSAGYGLAQWTYKTRKQGLYEATVEKGLSIADLGGQLTFLVKELKGYSSLNNLLRSTDNVNTASDKMLKDFERPAKLNYEVRRKYSKKYYDAYAKNISTENNTPEEDETVNTPVVENESAKVENNTEYQTYTVVTGDSWWGIAAKMLGSGVKMTDLAEFNGTTVKTILHPGDVIKLPIIRDDIEVEDAEPVTTKNYTIYTVLKGDSWWSIAAKTLGSGAKMVTLAKYNNKSITTMLHPGDKIRIPCKVSNSSTNYKTYTVKKNDSWWSIAASELGSGAKMKELAEFNGKSINTMLHPGNVLKIPK